MSDTHALSTLAERIWHHHYDGIISLEQIDYMLAQRYHPLLIQQQISNQDIWWRKLVLDEMMIGFSCCIR
ncbi:MAG: GNAT family N-acetyltransferase, partial [Pseudomonadota bacterium]